MSTQFESSAYFKDIEEITAAPANYVPYFYKEVTLHTKDKNLVQVDGIYITALDVNRDYVGSMGDYIEVVISSLVGTYIFDIRPYADDLEMTIKTYKQERNNKEAVVVEETYKAIYLTERNKDLPNTVTSGRLELNRNPPVSVSFQLLDKSVMALRLKTTQGVFNNVISEENKEMGADKLLTSIISTETDKIKIDKKKAIDKVSIEKSHNEEPLDELILPTGTKVVDVGEYIQTRNGGMYNSGLNTYVQRYVEAKNKDSQKVFFVYSLYDGDKYEESDAKIILYVSPNILYNVMDCTYKYKDRLLRIFTNPIAGLHDTKGSVLRSEGEGFKTAHAESFASKPVKIKEDGPHFSKADVITEVVNKERNDGLNNVPYKGISANHFVNTSEVLARKGEYIQVIINNLDMDFFYPGAPLMINYETGNGMIQELFGVLHKASCRYEQGVVDPTADHNRPLNPLTNRTVFTVYVTGPDKDEKAEANYFD